MAEQHPQQRAARLEALPEPGLAAIVAGLGAADRRALRAAFRSGRAAVDAHSTVAMHLTHGLVAAMARFRRVSALHLGAACILPDPKDWQAQAEAAVALACSLSKAAALLSSAAAPPPPVGSAPAQATAWAGVRRAEGCPLACAALLAALCPGLESLDLVACDSASIPDAAIDAMAALTALTRLRLGGVWAERSRPQQLGARGRSVLAALGGGRLAGLESLVFNHGIEGGVSLAPISALTRLTELVLPEAATGDWPSLGSLARLRRLTVREGSSLSGDNLGAVLSAFRAAGPPASLTELELCVSHDDYSHTPAVLFASALALLTALRSLRLPWADLSQPELEALAGAIGAQLTQLEADSLCANQGCSAVFPKLQRLTCSLHSFESSLFGMCPELECVELRFCNGDTSAWWQVAGGGDTRTLDLTLLDPLTEDYDTLDVSNYGGASAFEHCPPLHGLHLATPLSKGDVAAFEALCKSIRMAECADPAVGGTAGRPRLSLAGDAAALARMMFVAADECHQVQHLVVEVTAPSELGEGSSSCFVGRRLAAAAAAFGRLRSFELCLPLPCLRQPKEVSPDCGIGPHAEVFRIESLEQLEASRPACMSRVTLWNCTGISRERADGVERRAAAGGTPLQVTLRWGEGMPWRE